MVPSHGMDLVGCAILEQRARRSTLVRTGPKPDVTGKGGRAGTRFRPLRHVVYRVDTPQSAVEPNHSFLFQGGPHEATSEAGLDRGIDLVDSGPRAGSLASGGAKTGGPTGS